MAKHSGSLVLACHRRLEPPPNANRLIRRLFWDLPTRTRALKWGALTEKTKLKYGQIDTLASELLRQEKGSSPTGIQEESKPGAKMVCALRLVARRVNWKKSQPRRDRFTPPSLKASDNASRWCISAASSDVRDTCTRAEMQIGRTSSSRREGVAAGHRTAARRHTQVHACIGPARHGIPRRTQDLWLKLGA